MSGTEFSKNHPGSKTLGYSQVQSDFGAVSGRKIRYRPGLQPKSLTLIVKWEITLFELNLSVSHFWNWLMTQRQMVYQLTDDLSANFGVISTCVPPALCLLAGYVSIRRRCVYMLVQYHLLAVLPYVGGLSTRWQCGRPPYPVTGRVLYPQINWINKIAWPGWSGGNKFSRKNTMNILKLHRPCSPDLPSLWWRQNWWWYSLSHLLRKSETSQSWDPTRNPALKDQLPNWTPLPLLCFPFNNYNRTVLDS